MSRRVRIYLHMDDVNPGYIADYLRLRQIPYEVVRAYLGQPIAPLDDSVAGLIFMGGTMSANDNLDWLCQEIVLIEQALEQRVACLGHCLGGQLIAKALGQAVTPSAVAEVGWHACHRQSGAAAEDWLGDIEDPFIMFHWHYESFVVPTDGELLFSSRHCRNQAFSYRDNVLALQGHAEMTEALLTSWLEQWRSDLLEHSASVQNYSTIMAPMVENIAYLNRVAEQLYRRWTATLAL